MRGALTGWMAVVAFAALAPCANAQSGAPAAPRVEVWAGLDVVAPEQLGQIVSSYSPPLLFDGAYTSHGSQTVTLETSGHAGFEAGANFFFSPHAGIQVAFDRDSADLSGVNTPYDYSLHYISRPPPDSTPVPVDIHVSKPWPDTMGALTRTTLNANGVVRFGRPDRVSGTLSGGLSFHHVSGHAQPIAYSTFRLGGHSVLFGDEYKLDASFEPATAVGFNLGGDVSVGIGGGLALMAGYRFLGGPGIDMTVSAVSILNPDEVIVSQTPEEILKQLALPPTHLGMASSRFVVGLKFIH